MAELLGQHRYQLDAKGRMALPARFREAFADGLYLTLGEDGCLAAYPSEEWDRRKAEVRARPMGGRSARDYARMFFANAEAVSLDGQGRLVIPQKLRQQVGLEREAVVIGVSEYLEIWPAATWDRYEQARVGAYMSGSLEEEDKRR